MIKLFYCIFLNLITFCVMSQSSLPFKEIPQAPANMSAQNITARLIEGLGFRYYWATEGLRTQDLEFKPSLDSRSTSETLDHILGLSFSIANTVSGGNEPSVNTDTLDFDRKREYTLELLEKASRILRKMQDSEFEDLEVYFSRASGYPVWNLINGPVSDAIYHVGQVVTYRRSSGNPLPSGVSVFTGTRRE